jgi:NADH:ubiquinone oxidoreductase subunit 6 (subunit J)
VQQQTYSPRERSSDNQARRLTPRPVTQLGFWSAALTALFSIVFIAGFIMPRAGLLQAPWDVIVPIGASLLLAQTFVVMMVCVHYIAPDEKKIWSHTGLAFALLYAALVSIVYVVWLFVVESKFLSGYPEKVAPFIFEP